MEKCDSDGTYSSEAETILKKYDLRDRNQNCSQLQNVRRSQRLYQRFSAMKSPCRQPSEDCQQDRGEKLSETSPKKLRAQHISNSTQFLDREIDDCNETDARSIHSESQSEFLPSKKRRKYSEIMIVENGPIDLRIGRKRQDILSKKKDGLREGPRERQKIIDKDLSKDNVNHGGLISSHPVLGIAYEKDKEKYIKSKTYSRKQENKKLSLQRKNQKNTKKPIQNQRKRVVPVVENDKVVKYFRKNTRESFQPNEQTFLDDDTVIIPVPKLRGVTNSLLPKVYPPHFINQKPHSPDLTSEIPNSLQNNICLTPELSESFETEPEPSSSPSLPESLKGIFESDDIREILNIEKIQYKLNERHVKALAMVLDIREQFFRELLNNILKLDEHILKKIEIASKSAQPLESQVTMSSEVSTFPNDCFMAQEPQKSPTNSSCVECSQSPQSIKPRYFSSQRC